MIFRIEHDSTYTYTEPVFWEPHLFRFYPQEEPGQKLIFHSIEISPAVSGLRLQSDTENNMIHAGWFEGVHRQYKISVRIELAREARNPFDFLIYPEEANQIGFAYDEIERQLLAECLNTKPLEPFLLEFRDECLAQSAGRTFDFILCLNRRIFNDFDVEIREEEGLLDPAHTFGLKRGSCRDLTSMMIQMLRHSGLAARFVSGYLYIEQARPSFELHAWVEIYLPGAGWVGVDPSHGLVTGDFHIALCRSAFHENTLPVSGLFRGDAVSELSTALHIELQ